MSVCVLGVISYNLWRNNKDKNVREDLQHLMSKRSVHLIVMQEGANFYGLINALGRTDRDWEIVSYRGSKRAGKQNIILYRTSALELLTSKFTDLEEGNDAAPDRGITEALFKVKNSNRMFKVFASHMHSHVENASWWRLPRQLDFRKHVRVIKRRANRVPESRGVLAVADWNVNFRRAYVRRLPFFPTRQLRRAGMYSNWDALGRPAQGTKGTRLIDAVFLRRNGWMRFVDQKLIKLSSDHRAVYVRIVVGK